MFKLSKEKWTIFVGKIFVTLAVILVIVALYLIVKIALHKEPSKEVVHQKQITKEVYTQRLKDSIYTEILTLRLEHPEIVYQQIMHETGELTSVLFKTNKNLFGMKASGNRATTSNIVVNGYKWYPNWRESLIDYALFQMAYYRNLEKDEYYSKLGRSYAEDENYINLLKSRK